MQRHNIQSGWTHRAWRAALLLLIFAAAWDPAFTDGEWGGWTYYDGWDPIQNYWIKKCDTTLDRCECEKSEGTKLGCAYITISTGPSRPGSRLSPGLLRIMATEPTPMLASPVMLRHVETFGIQSVSALKTTSGVPRDVYVMDPDATMIQFRFAEGEAVALPVGAQSDVPYRLMMTDPEGWAVTNEPAHYDLYLGDGDLYRFSASTNSLKYLQMLLYRSAEGWEEPGGAEVLFDAYKAIRQVMAPSWLADVVTISGDKYEIRSYTHDDVEEEKNAEGLYVPKTEASSFKNWIIETPPPDYNWSKLRVTEVVGTSSNVSDFVYSAAAGEWELTKGGGLLVEVEATTGGRELTEPIVTTHTIQDSDGNIASQSRVTFGMHPWGPARTEEVQDPEGLAQTTQYTYYENPAEIGRYSKLRSELFPDGSWKVHDYDAQGRKAIIISPWTDSPFDSAAEDARAICYDYTPLDPADQLVFNDQRPRTATEKVLDTTVARTYFFYATNAAGESTDIEERCVNPSAVYGDPSNLRTVKTYYGPNAGPRLTGRLKTEQHPDGLLDTYSYEYGHYFVAAEPAACVFMSDPAGRAFRTTIIHGTTNNPNGIAYKTTKELFVIDSANNDVLMETHVYTGGENYERIIWTVKEFDLFGNATTTWRSNGEREDASWGAGCCGKEGETDAHGIEKLFEHDALGRLTAEIKLGTNSPADDLTTSYMYDPADRKIMETISGGGLSLTVSNEYDQAGRMVRNVNEAGLVSTYSFEHGGKTETLVKPGGATRITDRYLDGQLRSVTGTGDIPVYYDHGMNDDGTRWELKHTGYPNSPVWEKTVTDCLGRIIRVEKPGFGSVVLTNTHSYNAKGQRVRVSGFVSSESDMAPTLYEYDDFGDAFRSGSDVSRSGALDPVSTDRISESETYFLKEADVWWQMAESRHYPVDGSGIPVTARVRRVRLTGLGEGVLSERIFGDGPGHTTHETVVSDRTNKEVTRTTLFQDSTHPEIERMVNGLRVSFTTRTGIELSFGHDGLERQTAIINPRTGANRTHYNAYGQVEYEEDAAGNRTSFVYDPVTGLKTAVADALDNTIHYDHDSLGRVTNIWGAAYPLAHTYDLYGRRIEIKTWRNESGNPDITTWQYDEATGLLTNKMYADGQGPTYGYTADGKLARRVWARGVVTDYAYDVLGQTTNISYSDSTTGLSFNHNRAGEIVAVTDALGTRTHVYDTFTRALLEERLPDGTTLLRTFDEFNRPAGLFWGDQYAVQYAYDTVGRFSAITSVAASVSTECNYIYLPDSDLIEQVSNSLTRISYAYDPHRNLKTQVLNTFGANTVSCFDYSHDPLGRRVQRIDALSVTNDFDYNSRSELIEAILGTNSYLYQYDPIGNRELTQINSNTNEYDSNALNQYIRISGPESTNHPSHDADGNLTHYNGWTFTWDAENRLIEASNETTWIRNIYDYTSRRVEKTCPASTNRYIYDGWNLVCELKQAPHQPTSQTTNYFVWGLDLSRSLQGAGGIGGLLASIGGQTPAIRFFFCDANGNITELVDANGVLQAKYEYDPFGGTTMQWGPMSTGNTFRFSTRMWDENIGMYYYGYRFYLSQAGRWISRDPLEEAPGANLYAMVGNDPLNSIDPFGLYDPKKDCCLEGVVWNRKVRFFHNLSDPRQCKNPQQDPDYPPEVTPSIEAACGDKDTGWVPESPCFMLSLDYGKGIFNNSCVAHDRCWSTCGGRQGMAWRQHCDDAFRANLLAACNNSIVGVFWDRRLLCYACADLYYRAVARLGKATTGFKKAQVKHCLCCQD